jgi:uncharacterized membrane protein (DUF373 family)
MCIIHHDFREARACASVIALCRYGIDEEISRVTSEQDDSRHASSYPTISSRWKRWCVLSVQAQFEHVIVLFLSALIAAVVVLAVWSVALKVLAILLQASSLEAAEPAVFQTLFGMIFTVIIALEFRRTLLVITERQQSIVHVRAVVLIAILAIVRKLIIFDLAGGEAAELFALAAAILALGGVYWLVRDREKRDAV